MAFLFPEAPTSAVNSMMVTLSPWQWVVTGVTCLQSKRFLLIPHFLFLIHVPREPQERMEPLVSEETKETLALRVPGASR